jgi:hypothetical protein
MSMGIIRIKGYSTLFSPNISASTLNPSAPTLLSPRLNVVSVYERKLKMAVRKIKRKRCSPRFL